MAQGTFASGPVKTARGLHGAGGDAARSTERAAQGPGRHVRHGESSGKTSSAWLADLDKGISVEPTKMAMTELLRRWLDDEAAARVRGTTLAGYRATVENQPDPRTRQRAGVETDCGGRTAVSFRDDCRRHATDGAIGAARLKQALAWVVLPTSCRALSPPRSSRQQAKRRSAARGPRRKRGHSSPQPTGRPTNSGSGRRSTGSGVGRRSASGGRTLTCTAGPCPCGRPWSCCRARTARRRGPSSKNRSRRRRGQPLHFICKNYVAALHSHRDRQAFRRKRATSWHDNDLVFCTSNGHVLNPNNVLRNFDAIVAAAGVSEIGR